MGKTKYLKLSSSQKLEIVDYWEKYHQPYHVIANHFSQEWNQNVRLSTVSDIIYCWKKSKTIRGLSKLGTQTSVITSAVLDSLSVAFSLGFSLSKECLHAICIGEFRLRDMSTESLSLLDVEQVLENNPQLKASGLWNGYAMGMGMQSLGNLEFPLSANSQSSVLFLDSFSLLYRCIPYLPFCCNRSSTHQLYCEQLCCYVVYSGDGTFRTPPFVFGSSFTTDPDDNWRIEKLKKRQKGGVQRSRKDTEAGALLRLLLWLDHVVDSSHLLLFDNVEGLIQSVNETDKEQRVLFASPEIGEITLRSLRLAFVPHFALCSPFKEIICRVLKLRYRYYRFLCVTDRSLFLQKLLSMQVNHRGYKRLLSIDDCYPLLERAWKEMPDSFLVECIAESKLVLTGTVKGDRESTSRAAQEEYESALNHFYSLFSIRQEDHLSAEGYLHLENLPFINGVSSVFECLRDASFRDYLFNHGFYPESSLFPPSSSFLPNPLSVGREHSNPIGSCGPEASFMNPPPFSPVLDENSEPTDLFFRPTAEVVDRFCNCLDVFLGDARGFSADEILYYDKLKERIRRHYCS